MGKIDVSDRKAIGKYLGDMWQRLKNRKRRRPWSSNKWLRKVKGEGIYGVFKNDKIVYVGISANLRERMSDLERTVNHTLPQKLGLELLRRKMPKTGYSHKDSQKIRRYIEQNFEIAFQPLMLGRKELESWIIKKKKPIYNKEEKRGQPK